MRPVATAVHSGGWGWRLHCGAPVCRRILTTCLGDKWRWPPAHVSARGCIARRHTTDFTRQGGKINSDSRVLLLMLFFTITVKKWRSNKTNSLAEHTHLDQKRDLFVWAYHIWILAFHIFRNNVRIEFLIGLDRNISAWKQIKHTVKIIFQLDQFIILTLHISLHKRCVSMFVCAVIRAACLNRKYPSNRPYLRKLR